MKLLRLKNILFIGAECTQYPSIADWEEECCTDALNTRFCSECGLYRACRRSSDRYNFVSTFLLSRGVTL